LLCGKLPEMLSNWNRYWSSELKTSLKWRFLETWSCCCMFGVKWSIKI
jgi:hypothetical protein